MLSTTSFNVFGLTGYIYFLTSITIKLAQRGIRKNLKHSESLVWKKRGSDDDKKEKEETNGKNILSTKHNLLDEMQA
ncbi:hypothetical protein NC651_005649 [Populus alba x Populus x berolinensis]|nr:hypothetical protein NC651_005649 [Populus alba x Populus x berolinensis]